MKSPSKTVERLGLKGKLAALPWVTVSRSEKGAGATGEKVVHNVRTAEDIAKAFSRRPRDTPR